jgi:hypothetical protein
MGWQLKRGQILSSDLPRLPGPERERHDRGDVGVELPPDDERGGRRRPSLAGASQAKYLQIFL